jgi:purine-binding chemotaxis protein CheW
MTVVGAQTDTAQETLDLPDEAIETPPRLNMKLRADFIRDTGRKNKSLIIILDLELVFSSDELALLQAAGNV